MYGSPSGTSLEGTVFWDILSAILSYWDHTRNIRTLVSSPGLAFSGKEDLSIVKDQSAR